MAISFDQIGADEEVIAYLPLAWVGDHVFSYAQSYVAGYCVNCPEAAGNRGARTAARSARPTHSRRLAFTKTSSR